MGGATWRLSLLALWTERVAVKDEIVGSSLTI